MAGLLAVLTLVIAPAGAAPSITNGSFEADDWSAGLVGDLPGAGGGVTGWTIVGPAGGDVHPEGRANGFGAGPTPFGDQWVVLGGYGLGGNYIEQTVFGDGGEYKLTFSISSEDNGGIDGLSGIGANVLVSFPGSLVPSAGYTAPPSTGFQGWDVWGTFTYAFLAPAGPLTIRFTDLGSTTFNDIGLDNVSLRVPLPPAVLLLGLGTAALALSRRRRTA
jgi:hypothetical protein